MDMVYVEDCCEILDSLRVPITASHREEGAYPYYGANGIQDYVADYIFDDDLVLLAEDGGNFCSKDRAIAYRVSGKCWVNNHAHVLKPKAGMDVDYLCYSLMFYKVDGMVNGATRQKLTQAAMRKMQIPLRSMDEQVRIADELNRVIKIKEQRQQELGLLDDLIKARFVEMFGDPLINSYGIEIKPMTEVCDIIDGDRGKNYPTVDDFSEDGYCLFLNAKNVTASGFCFETCMFVTKEKDEALRKGKLSRGDVVLTTRGTIGNLAFYTDDIPFKHVRINSGMVILRMKQDVIDEVYFIEQFKMQLADIKEKIASGSAQPQLPISTMNKIQILIPSIEKQRQFADFVRFVDKSKVAVQKALDETQTLFDSLMQEYFG